MIYAFDRYVVREQQRQLLRDGMCLPLPPWLFDALLFLIKNRERVVSPPELLESCWPGIPVADRMLSRCLTRIRDIIGQPTAANEPIQIRPGSGYRFVGDVRIEDTNGSDDARLDGAEDGPVEVAATVPCTAERRFVSTVDCLLRQARPDADMQAYSEALGKFLSACGRILDGLPCSIVDQSHVTGRVLIQVGYPYAAERPAAIAVSFGRELIDLATDMDLKATVTIASDWALVGARAGGPPPGHLLAGLHPNASARLEGASPDGALVADAATVSLLDGQVPVTETATVIADGRQRKLFALGRSGTAFDPLNAGLRELPFVGRGWDIVRMRDRWRRTADGEGQIVLVTGEPGIGKSRLVLELLSTVSVPATGMFAVSCSRFHRSEPFHAFRNLLWQVLGVDHDAPLSKQRKAIEDLPNRFGPTVIDQLGPLASLLSVPLAAGESPDAGLDPEELRERTMRALIILIRAIAQSGPAVLWVDDLHWADPSTLETLERLAPRVEGQLLMLILSQRDDGQVQIPDMDNVTRVDLGPLSRRSCEDILAALSKSGLIPSESIEEIAARSDGVPLFLREIARMASSPSEDHRMEPNRMAVPDGLQGLLASRLDQCGEAKPVAQWAAVIGRTFSRELLAHLVACPEHELRKHLDTLVTAGVLQVERPGQDSRYRFARSLVRDAAYESLPLPIRRARHGQVADLIVDLFPGLAAARPERIAGHYAASNDPSLGAAYWLAARHRRSAGCLP